MKTTIVIIGIFCLLTTQISAENEPGDCALTTEFGIQVAGCFLDKFKPLLDLIPKSSVSIQDPIPPKVPHSQDSSIPFGNKDYGRLPQSYVLKSILSRLKTEQKIKITEETLKAQERKLKEEVAEQIIKNVDFVKIQEALSGKIVEIIGAIREHVLEQTSLKAPREISPLAVWGDIKNFACLLSKEYCRILNCVEEYNEIDFEDDLKWVKCAYTCSDLTPIGQCMHTAFSNCKVSLLNELININLEWLADIALRVVVDYLEMDTCIFNIEGYNQFIEIEEGGPPASITITNYLPPGVHCMNKLKFINTPAGVGKLLYEFITGSLGKCKVEIEMSLSNYLKDALSINVPVIGVIQNPVCPSGKLIPQAVVRANDLNTTTGTIQLDETNWNETFTVQVQATVNNKKQFPNDKMLFSNESLSVRLRAGLLSKHTTKIELQNKREDVNRVRTCWTVSDPHVNTFDGHYYNNMYEGYFYLYKHKELPYEVQVVYQRCGQNRKATCTCAASVKSGDDVFTVDWCRRKGEADEGRAKRVTLYLISKTINPGTRIFRRDEGFTYKVLLPHGQMVTIGSTDGWLNVWVRPSAFDKNATLGLCGNFDDNENQDLVFPNGTVYEDEGSKRKEQPGPFINAWRVPEDERILKGASMNTSTIPDPEPEFCTCSHIVLLGVKCTCGYDQLARVCDHETEGELMEELSLITKYSVKQFLVDHPTEKDDDLPDVDVSYDPPDIVWNNPVKKKCEEWIKNDPVQSKCNPYAIDPFGKWKKELIAKGFKDVCEEDAQISEDKTNLSLSSRMAARQYCYDTLDFYFNKNQGKYDTVFALDCPNDCNPHLSTENKCKNGTCVCDSLYQGPDCSFGADEKPVILMPKYSPCDSRYTNCSFATVYGKYFVSGRSVCLISSEESSQEIDPLIFSPYQLACKLPTSGGSFTISIKHKESRVTREASTTSTSFVFQTFDSQCHVCNTTTGKCRERKAKDYCYVDGQCYATGEVSSKDECYYCDPTKSQDELMYSENDHCTTKKQEKLDSEKEWNTRVIVACVLSVLIIAVTIILFAFSRTSKNGKDMELITGGVGTSTAYKEDAPNTGYSQTIDGNIYDVPDAGPMGRMDEAHPVPDSEYLQAVPNPSGAGGNEINAKELAEFWYFKQMAQERSRKRSESVGSRSSSIGSTGIGGSGPSHMAVSRVRSESMASFGMGAAGPAHMGRFARRAYSNSSAGITDDEDPVDKFGIGGGGTGGMGMVSRL